MSAWAYIAHKDGYWAGLHSARAIDREFNKAEKSDLAKFIARFVADGFSITTVESREEYNWVLETMKGWHESPEYIAKHQPKKAAPPIAEPMLL